MNRRLCSWPSFLLISVVGVTIGEDGQDKQPVLDYLPRLDSLRSLVPSESIQRRGSVDVIQNLSRVSIEAGIALEEEEEEIGICHLVHMFEASVLLPENFRALIDVFGSWEGTAAIALAAEHMNTGNGTVVPEIQGLNKRCNIRFTLESVDNENSQNDSVERMIELTDREPGRERLPCGIIGPYLSRNSLASALLLGIRGYPQLSPTASTPELDIKAQYPLFGRPVPSTEKLGELVIWYLNKILGVRYLGVLYHPDEYGKGFTLGLQLAVNKIAPDMVVASVELVRREDNDEEAKQEDIARSMGFLKDTEFTYFISLMNHEFHDPVMEEAFRQGIAGTGKHNWFFTEVLGPTYVTERTFPKGSPLDLVHGGASRFQVTAGVPGLSPRFDKLEAVLKEFKNDRDVEYLRTVLPKYTTHNDSIYDQILYADAFLQVAEHPTAFVYDAAVTFGLAACNATRGEDFFDGPTHYGSIVQTSFYGSSGKIVYDPKTGSRVASSMTFELVTHHLDPSKETEEEVGFKLVRSAIYQENEWKQLEPLLFNDGTYNIPADLPHIDVDQNLLTPGLRAGGLIMCGIILLLSMAFAVWTEMNKKSRVVMAAQPIFLHIICLGAFVTGSSIIPLSIDPGVASDKGCDRACMAFPWLVIIGFSMMMSALWAKTKRIHQIIQNGFTFRRVTVTVYDVSKPMLIILTANIVLLSIWTVISPLYLDTQIVSVDIFDRAIETVSLCKWSDSVPFYAVLAALNFLLLCYSLFVAWQARDISTELSESDYIFKAMAVIVLVCFIGIPVIILARENPAAYFYVCTGIIFVTSTSILLLIFLPKLAAFYQAKYHDRIPRSSSKVPERFRKKSLSGVNTSDALHSRGFQGKSEERSAYEDEFSSRSGEPDQGIMILKSKQELEDELQRAHAENCSLLKEIQKLKGGENPKETPQKSKGGEGQEADRSESAIDLPTLEMEQDQAKNYPY